MYLSKSGKIYLASQYLGNYGGYTAIKNTILQAFSKKREIVARSFNLGNAHFKKADAKEVEVRFSRNGESITSKNIFGRSGAIVFKKQSRDDGFELEVRSKLLAHTGKPPKEMRKLIAELMRSYKLLDVADSDIEDCKVIALVEGNRKTIHLLEDSSFASRFFVDVKLNADGHPKYEPLKEVAIDLLEKEIISRKEDV